MIDIETPHGLARAHLLAADDPVGALVLGHGAGGGVATPDLTAAADAANASCFTAVLVEQPYRVAGRRSQPPRDHLDRAWLAVLERLRAAELQGLPLVVGGRSAGARVACRTASQAEAIAVLCLAFPLHPPGRANDPTKSRLAELEGVRVPVLVVQGERDPFGMPPRGRRRTVVRVAGNHSLRNQALIRAAVAKWLKRVI
jgi:predicted alpha/beta-hydrolase family hydrolase